MNEEFVKKMLEVVWKFLEGKEYVTTTHTQHDPITKIPTEVRTHKFVAHKESKE